MGKDREGGREFLLTKKIQSYKAGVIQQVSPRLEQSTRHLASRKGACHGWAEPVLSRYLSIIPKLGLLKSRSVLQRGLGPKLQVGLLLATHPGRSQQRSPIEADTIPHPKGSWVSSP